MEIDPNYGLIWKSDPLHGVKFKTHKVKNNLINSRESSFQYTATRIYNILTRDMRDDIVSFLDIWKMKLDELLEKIAPQPRTKI